ncbi:MAG: hypothetical protein EAZ97_03865 [Bacteroidetes bacterium]|nr:MAG: hypothetical protein EAZ97_03865 [Bacteroidota bacterium]
MDRIFLLFILLLLCKILFAQPKGLNPDKTLDKYLVESWTKENGLVSNKLNSGVQDSEGFLWIASYNGFSQFDGVKFLNKSKRNLPVLSTNGIYVIEKDQRNIVWFGTQGSGLIAYQNGKYHSFKDSTILKNYSIEDIYVESKDKLWIGSRGKGVYIYDYQQFKHFNTCPKLLDVTVGTIYKDKSGAIWFGTQGNGLIIYKDGKFKILDEKNGLKNNVEMIIEDKKGVFWLGTTSGLFTYDGKKITEVSAFKNNNVIEILEDSYGSIWFATADGLFRKNGKTNIFEKITEKNGLPDKHISHLFFDNENSLWITTYNAGLCRIRDSKFINYDILDGLKANGVTAAAELDQNRILVGTENGLSVIQGDSVVSFDLKTKLDNFRIRTILFDSRKNIWIGTNNGLIKMNPNGKETFFSQKNLLPEDLVRYVFEDKEGFIWIGTRNKGIIKIDKKDQKVAEFNKENGLNSNFIMSINQAQNGDMLIATNSGGLNILKKNLENESFTEKEQMPTNVIFYAHKDENQVIWVASNGGLSRIENKKIVNYSNKQGLPAEGVYDIIEDKNNNFWLPTAEGIIKVKRKELDAFAKDNSQKINWILYDKGAGILGECNGTCKAIYTKNGDLWFPTIGGLCTTKPEQEVKNTQIPLIKITEFNVDEHSVNLEKSIVLDAQTQRIVINFSVLSFIRPEKVKFKYKLEGFDKNWIEGNDQHRYAIYTNLEHGKYTFKIKASNNDGLWNEEGDQIAFEIEPYFYQTTQFILVMIFAFLLSIFGFYKWRIRAVSIRNLMLEKLISQRTSELQSEKNKLEKQENETQIAYQRVEKTYEILKQKNQDITDSIRYAQTVQQGFLPRTLKINLFFEEHFIIYKAKDFVSGDFYFFSGEKNPAGIFMAAIDCTGHGIPAAFMSIVGNTLLSEIINQKQIASPAQILDMLNEGVIRALNQKENSNDDGMDICLCRLTKNIDMEITFSGAKRPLFYTKNQVLHELKGDHKAIGGLKTKKLFFTEQQIILQKNDLIYLTTDGFMDQNNLEREKFGTNQFKELLQKNMNLSLAKQRDILESTLQDHQKNAEQRDDITVWGLRL